MEIYRSILVLERSPILPNISTKSYFEVAAFNLSNDIASSPLKLIEKEVL